MADSIQTGFGQWTERPRLSLSSIGLSALFTTLLIYSSAITTFQTFSNLSLIILHFSRISLFTAFAVGILCMAAVLSGRRLSYRSLSVLASLTYALGCMGFVILLYTGADQAFILWAAAIICGIGDVLICLVWGRIFRRFGLRNALLNIAFATLVTSCVDKVMMVSSNLVVLCIFSACVIVCIIFALTAGQTDGSSPADDDKASVQTGRSAMAQVRSAAGVTATSTIGLITFAFVMGFLRIDFVPMFDFHLIASGIAALIAIGMVFFAFKRPVSVFINQVLLPCLAVIVLLMCNIVSLIDLPTSASVFSILIIYDCAAMFALSMCTATAHAAEFSSDLIFSILLAAFGLASALGQIVGGLCPDSMLINVALFITTAYAFLLAFTPGIARWIANERREGTVPPTDDAVASRQSDDDVAVVASYDERLTEACEKLAARDGLTTRETEIVQYLARGHTSTYIAEVLFISSNTARTHIHNIYHKTDASSREGLMLMVQDIMDASTADAAHKGNRK